MTRPVILTDHPKGLVMVTMDLDPLPVIMTLSVMVNPDDLGWNVHGAPLGLVMTH